MADQPPPTKPFVVVRDDAPEKRALAGAVVAMGTFDGVHRGHRAVIGTAMARARALGRPAAVLTFEPPPRAFFNPGQPLFRLADERNKLRLLATTGLDGTIILTFDAALASLSAQDFVNDILVGRYGVAGAVVGFNFHFGKNRGGSPDFLAAAGAAQGFAVDVVAPVADEGQRISSGQIRAALAQGLAAEASELLGYPWFVTGTVVAGDRRGRLLGYPTANLRLDTACGLRHGIYAVRVGLGDRRLDGVASFGRRPTFDDGPPVLEVFLFDFAEDIYGRDLDVAFIAWIRDERKFDTVDELVRQMDGDSAQAKAALARAGDAFPPVEPLPSERG
jgi:riboflavin kinase/FMN adenylyltransferase